jgi:LysR family transcriptional regulator, hydrogen peroxide-inducible genes activator
LPEIRGSRAWRRGPFFVFAFRRYGVTAMTAFTPSLRQLTYLVELDAQRHFGRAASALGVGQSTLSAGIAELERLVGVQLVERTKRSVRFTSLGEAYVARARPVVEASLALTEFASAASAPLTGTLRLGIIPTIAPFLLPRVLGPLRAKFPALDLHVREQTSEAACAALHRGALDCVLLALPFDCGRIEHEEVMRDPLFIGVPEGRVGEGFDPGTLLLLEDGHCLNEHGLTACGIPRGRDPAMVATSLHTLVGMVDAGLGTTFLPRLAIDAGILAGRRVTATPLGGNAERRIVLAWRQGSANAPDFRTLAQVLAELGAPVS